MIKFLKIIQKVLLMIAIIGASCPSQLNTYKPKVPKELKKYLK